MYAVESYIPSKAQQLQVGRLGLEEQLKFNLQQSLDAELEEKQRKIQAGI